MLGVSSESFTEKAKMSAVSTSYCNSYWVTGWLTVVPAMADDTVPTLILLMNWCYTKMASDRLCTKYYQNWSMSVEDIASQSSVIFEHD